MKLWQQIGLVTIAALLFLGARIYFVWKARQDPGAVASLGNATKPPTQDELAVIAQYYFASFDQAKQQLEGKPVWIKAGYSLAYYPYGGGAVQFAKRAGVLPGAEKLSVSKLIKAVAPAKEDNRIEHGSKQYFIVFTIDGPDQQPGTFAAPIGFAQGDQETLVCDQLFYYEDPKSIYDHWPQPVWDAVAKHTPTVGMTENQARMAAGILIESDSTSIGDRTATFDEGNKKWTVTFVKGVATQVKEG